MSKESFQAISSAATFPRLRDVAFEHLLDLGVTKLSYHHHPPIGAFDYSQTITIASVGFPERWIKQYVEHDYLSADPIVRYASTATRPFRWSEISNLTDISQKERSYLRQVMKHNLGDGLAVPVFGPHGRDGYFGVGFNENACPTDSYEQSQVQHFCQNIHLRYCELLQASTPTIPKLSVQERAALKLVIHGLTNAQIASEMGVTKKTVATYLDRCFDKLDVHDRMAAALKSHAAGLLD